jgi:DNA-directed RNA polymerase subunit M/transcription elongation factor TFIIS
MESINQADEYHRLQELYAEMSDAQIDGMSAEMENLTEIAQQVLRAEISRRGLGPQGLGAQQDPREAARQALRAEKAERDLEAPDQDSAGEAEDAVEARSLVGLLNLGARDPLSKGYDPTAFDLVGIWNVSDPTQARQFMSLLDSAGVKAYLGPDSVERVEDYRGRYEEGVELKVMKFQAKLASDLLHQHAPPETEKDSLEDADYAVFCPSCNSRDVIFQGLDVEPGKEPAPGAKYNWTCSACGHVWKDDGIEKVA